MRAFTQRSSILGTTAVANFFRLRHCTTQAATEKAQNEKNSKTGSENEVTAESLKKLEKQVEESKAQIEELKKDVLYRAADAENARRIAREDVDKAKLYGITSFSKDMLEVADTLEKAIEAFKAFSEEELQSNKMVNSIFTGVKLSSKVLLSNMSKHGIEKINVAVGTKFDPNLHDALVITPATAEAPGEHISTVLKNGYTLKQRVLRAAQVGVSRDE